jgi:hypothetical protein
MIIKCDETIFFYRKKGLLRQAVDVWLDGFPTDMPVSITIMTKNHGHCSTDFSRIPGTGRALRCMAPVVYPNLVDGVCRPEPAKLSVRCGAICREKEFLLGRHRPWRIHVCQDICTDYTWGMPYEQTMAESRAMIRTQLSEMDRTDHLPVESRNRWNVNQTMELEWFIRDEDAALVDRLFAREKERRLEISATYNSNLTALLGTEQAIRSLYFAAALNRTYGIRLNTLEHIEMPTLTWGMISIYAQAGIRYLTKAWLDFNSHYLRKSPDWPLFRWVGPDGSSLLTFMDRDANLRYHYGHAHFMSGSMMQKPYSYQEVLDELHGWWIPHYELNRYYPFDSFMMLGAYIDLHVHSKQEVRPLVDMIARYGAEPWEFPKLINSTWTGFFESIEKFTFDNDVVIPECAGDMGVSWEDWPAHYAHIAADFKHGADELFMAEKLDTLRLMLAGTPIEGARELLSESTVLMNRLAEHPWNGSNDDEKHRSMETRDGWAKRLLANTRLVRERFFDTCPPTVESRLPVFNLLSWPRTDLVGFDGRMAGMDYAQGVVQEIEESGVWRTVCVAREVPGIGCRLLELSSPGNSSGRRVEAIGNILENSFYRIEISQENGSITSLWDKKNNRELVAVHEPHGLNQFCYRSEANGHTLADIEIHPVNCGAIQASLLITGRALRCSAESIITLYRDLDKIVIRNRLEKEPSCERQELYYLFPFNVPDRQYHYDCAGSILVPGLQRLGGDHIDGAGLEVYSTRNFIDVSNADYGVTLVPHDSYLFQLGKPTYDLMPDGPEPGNATVWALVLTNHAYAEILRDQGGNKSFSFCFSLTSHSGGFDAVQALRFGWGENNPLLCGTPQTVLPEGFPDGQVPILECGPDNVVITALKPAEDGDGSMILRLWEISGIPTMATIEVHGVRLRRVVGCDLLERSRAMGIPVEHGRFTVPLTGRGLETVRLYCDG